MILTICILAATAIVECLIVWLGIKWGIFAPKSKKRSYSEIKVQ